MRQENNCIFCRIVRDEAPAIKIYENEHALAFMDINPASEGHTLVVSKEHFENILDIDAPTLAAVSLATQHLASTIYRALEPDGMRVSQFNGTAAGQTVFHYHAHLIPIRRGQQVGSHGQGPGNLEQIKEIARKISAAL